MSLLDPLFWAFGQFDAQLARLPAGLRLAIWAALGAVVSLELYRLAAPQHRIRDLQLALRQAQERVARFDGEFAEGWPLIRGMLALALKRVWLVLPGTLIASVPLLVLILWLAVAYGAFYPPAGSEVGVRAPGSLIGRWIEADAGTGRRQVEVLTPQGDLVTRTEVAAPVSVIAKRRWWNAILGNPAGYLPEDSPVDWVEIELPRQQFLSAGPWWLRGWEAIFLPSLVLIALGYKTLRRIA
jgi:hypothetical protein